MQLRNQKLHHREWWPTRLNKLGILGVWNFSDRPTQFVWGLSEKFQTEPKKFQIRLLGTSRPFWLVGGIRVVNRANHSHKPTQSHSLPQLLINPNTSSWSLGVMRVSHGVKVPTGLPVENISDLPLCATSPKRQVAGTSGTRCWMKPGGTWRSADGNSQTAILVSTQGRNVNQKGSFGVLRACRGLCRSEPWPASISGI